MGISRREFIKSMGAGAALGLAGGWPKLSFATLPTDNRFILVILRGALDGLAAVPPYGDPHYKEARNGLGFNAPGQENGALDLNGFFGLNPAMQPLMPLYEARQLSVIHAVASSYRERSHFDAQNVLENGLIRPGGTAGWLNRALESLGGGVGAGIAINQQVPFVLQGKVDVASWAPKGKEINANSGYMTKMKALYEADALLAPVFAEAMRTQAMAEKSLSMEDQNAGQTAKNVAQLYAAAKGAANFLTQDAGPRVAVLEAAGWDTHLNQGVATGQLYNRLADLANGLSVIPEAMGEHWKKTVVVVVTEFGRTVAMNGTGGTDHGTGGMAMVMGGSVNGGNVLSKWPGLGHENLYQGRDLKPTLDMRSIFKTVLSAHLKASNSAIENTIFPDSASAGMIKGLFL